MRRVKAAKTAKNMKVRILARINMWKCCSSLLANRVRSVIAGNLDLCLYFAQDMGKDK